MTRPRELSRELVCALRELGAVVVAAPAIRIRPPENFAALDAEIRRLESYDWLILTSVNGAKYFFQRAKKIAPRQPAALKVAAVGPSTARAVRAKGYRVGLVPADFRAEGLLAKLRVSRGLRILLPRAEKARAMLPRSLRRRGASVKVVTAYRTVFERAGWRRLSRRLLDGKIDAISFASGSTVDAFFAYFGAASGRRILTRARPVSIGPVTTAALKRHGVARAAQAHTQTTRGLVRAMRGLLR